jgi:hypothetical protein
MQFLKRFLSQAPTTPVTPVPAAPVPTTTTPEMSMSSLPDPRAVPVPLPKVGPRGDAFNEYGREAFVEKIRRAGAIPEGYGPAVSHDALPQAGGKVAETFGGALPDPRAVAVPTPKLGYRGEPLSLEQQQYFRGRIQTALHNAGAPASAMASAAPRAPGVPSVFGTYFDAGMLPDPRAVAVPTPKVDATGQPLAPTQRDYFAQRIEQALGRAAPRQEPHVTLDPRSVPIPAPKVGPRGEPLPESKREYYAQRVQEGDVALRAQQAGAPRPVVRGVAQGVGAVGASAAPEAYGQTYRVVRTVTRVEETFVNATSPEAALAKAQNPNNWYSWGEVDEPVIGGYQATLATNDAEAEDDYEDDYESDDGYAY